eukprot:gene6983-4947_t
MSRAASLSFRHWSISTAPTTTCSPRTGRTAYRLRGPSLCQRRAEGRNTFFSTLFVSRRCLHVSLVSRQQPPPPDKPSTPFRYFVTRSEDSLQRLAREKAGRAPPAARGSTESAFTRKRQPVGQDEEADRQQEASNGAGAGRRDQRWSARSLSFTLKPVYRNKFTAFLFKELDKGLDSPLVVLACGLIFGIAGYKLLYHKVESRQQRLQHLTPRSRVPMTATHEAMWGFRTFAAPERDEETGEVRQGRFMEATQPGASVFDPAVAVAEAEPMLQRPRLIHTEVRDPVDINDPLYHQALERRRKNGTDEAGEVAVIMEMPEYDARIQDDVCYRSLHYVKTSASDSGGNASKSIGAEHSSGAWWTSSLPSWRFWETASGPSAGNENSVNSSSMSSSSSSIARRNTNAAVGEDSAASASGADSPFDHYYRYMPGEGKEHIHGLVKCKRADPAAPVDVQEDMSCVPYPGDLARELSRKLLLALGPTQIMQDTTRNILPMRFSRLKQQEVRTLIIGLRGGELARWISAAYPNFVVDVVEPDLSLIRMAKRYLGFKEHATLTLSPMDPMSFVRAKAAEVESFLTESETTVQLRALFIPWKRAPTSRSSSKIDAALNKKGQDYDPVKDPRPYDLILIDAFDTTGRLPTFFGRLDFIQQLRKILAPTGCVAIAVPNRDPTYLYHMVQHWRMGFQGRSMLLSHCQQEPATVLITFQDEAGRGHGNMGELRDAQEMKDIIRTHLTQYGADRVPAFDLTREVDGGARRPQLYQQQQQSQGTTTTTAAAAVDPKDSSAGFFKVLEADKRYTAADYVPPGHPFLRGGLGPLTAGAAAGGPAKRSDPPNRPMEKKTMKNPKRIAASYNNCVLWYSKTEELNESSSGRVKRCFLSLSLIRWWELTSGTAAALGAGLSYSPNPNPSLSLSPTHPHTHTPTHPHTHIYIYMHSLSSFTTTNLKEGDSRREIAFRSNKQTNNR